jgi:hypothetical protein
VEAGNLTWTNAAELLGLSCACRLPKSGPWCPDYPYIEPSYLLNEAG